MAVVVVLGVFHETGLSDAPGSGPFGAVAHTAWLGHPSHAADLPACSLAVPGQPLCVVSFGGRRKEERG